MQCTTHIGRFAPATLLTIVTSLSVWWRRRLHAFARFYLEIDWLFRSCTWRKQTPRYAVHAALRVAPPHEGRPQVGSVPLGCLRFQNGSSPAGGIRGHCGGEPAVGEARLPRAAVRSAGHRQARRPQPQQRVCLLPHFGCGYKLPLFKSFQASLPSVMQWRPASRGTRRSGRALQSASAAGRAGSAAQPAGAGDAFALVAWLSLHFIGLEYHEVLGFELLESPRSTFELLLQLEREQAQARAVLETKRQEAGASACRLKTLGQQLHGFQNASRQWQGCDADIATPV